MMCQFPAAWDGLASHCGQTLWFASHKRPLSVFFFVSSNHSPHREVRSPGTLVKHLEKRNGVSYGLHHTSQQRPSQEGFQIKSRAKCSCVFLWVSDLTFMISGPQQATGTAASTHADWLVHVLRKTSPAPVVRARARRVVHMRGMSVDKNAPVCETNQLLTLWRETVPLRCPPRPPTFGAESLGARKWKKNATRSNLWQSSDGISCVLIFPRYSDPDISHLKRRVGADAPDDSVAR